MREIHVTKARSWVKMLIHRAICSAETYLIARIIYHYFKDEHQAALTQTLFLLGLKSLTYFLYERVWDQVQWGRYTKEVNDE